MRHLNFGTYRFHRILIFSKSNEESTEKSKKTSDLDDSLKLFKSITKKKRNQGKVKPPQASNIVTSFIDQPAKVAKIPKTKATKEKKVTNSETCLQKLINDECRDDGLDPEEVQVALAMSESMNPPENQNKTQVVTKSVKSISAKLEQYGFKTSKNYEKIGLELFANQKLSKRSKYTKFHTVLSKTSESRRKKTTNVKINRILDVTNDMMNCVTFTDNEKVKYFPSSSLLQEYFDVSTVFELNSGSQATSDTLTEYYVTDLFEPSLVPIDYLLRDWKDIVGRDSSPVRETHTKITDENVEEDFEIADTSCFDIFADEQAKEELETNLNLLHQTLSQSFHPDLEIDLVEKQDDQINSNTTVPITENNQEHEESDDEIDFTIPIDDSLHNLKRNLKVILDVNETVDIDFQKSFEEDDKDVTVISDDEVDDSQIQESVELPEDDEVAVISDEEVNNPKSKVEFHDLSQDDDDVTLISDEEVNYSNLKRKFESSSETQKEIDDEIAIISDEEVNYSVRHYNDPIDECLVVEENLDENDFMPDYCLDDCNINQTVSELLEVSMYHGSKSPEPDNSIHDNFSESIRNIMMKYGDNSTSVLGKFQSLGNFNTREESIRVSIDDENVLRENSDKKSTKQPLKTVIDLDDKEFVIETQLPDIYVDFKNMTPVELKQCLFKYGIRSLSTKKAVTILEFIYNRIHPEFECMNVSHQKSRALNVTDILTNIVCENEDNFPFRASLLDNEEIVLPKPARKKIPSCPIPLHISFFNMLRSSLKMQSFILEYRPVELESIYQHFRKFELTYEINEIIAFLDRRCITFKTKEKSLSKTHERKKNFRQNKKK